jgi:hypothetical protein
MDVIAPRLASLERQVNDAKRDLIKNTYRPIMGWAGAISLGLYSGLIPTQIAGLASAIGFTQAASNIIQNVLALRDKQKQVRADDLYFLWRVKEKARRNSGRN